MMDADLARHVRDLTLELVAFPSVNGTPGEFALGRALAERLRSLGGGRPIEVQEVPADNDRLERPVVFARLRGRRSDRAVLLMGHYDVVDVQDYGEQRDLAFDPVALTHWLAEHGEGAIRDLAGSGDYLFGRGVLDMKSGVATCVALLERLSKAQPLDGDVIVALAPDEEANSVGVKTVRRVCGEIERGEGVQFVAALNTDSTSPEGQEDAHHYGYTGSIGKLLPAVFIGALPTHATRLSQGFVDPAALLGRVLQHITAHPDLVDRHGEQQAAPPIVLHMADSRRGYDVQTLQWAWGYLNLLNMSRSPSEVLLRVRALVRAGLDLATEEVSRRMQALGLSPVPSVPVYSFAELYQRLLAERPATAERIVQRMASLPAGMDLRERSRAVVEEVWRASGSGPMAIVFFAQDIMPRVLTESADLTLALRGALSQHGLSGNFITRPIYPGISDMSFLAASPDDPHLAAFRADYPLAPITPPLPPAPTMPMLNIGPSGLDPHQPTERVEVRWSFGVMPDVVLRIVQSLLSTAAG